MSAANRWFLKIHAFLHDPPHKPLVLGRGHGRQGREIATALAGGDLDDASRRVVQQADHLASGADRQNWLRDFDINPRKELQLVHPLEGKPVLVAGTVTGRPFELVFPEECVDAVAALGSRIPETLKHVADLRLRFLVLWRFLPEILEALEGERGTDRARLGLLWPLLPADSRIPDHSVLVHDSLVSALAAILADGHGAALLRVQFAPVQDFIEASRKLRDLWASSSILAETTWAAMEPVVERFGPDHILFPSLRYEPRFDRWLVQQLRGMEEAHAALREVVETTRAHSKRALRTPSLPNLFTAIVPQNSAAEIAGEIERKLREFWTESVALAAREAGEGPEFVERAKEQARALLQVFWSVVPWPLDIGPAQWLQAQDPPSAWHKNQPVLQRTLQTLRHLSHAFQGYEPNAGLLYADLNDQAALLVDAVKRERIQHTHDEGGLKCSCCGEREVLGGNDFWAQRTEGYAKRKDQKQLSDNEQLCGPCTWKRSFELPVADGDEDTRSFGQRHPSTGEIAAAQFKLDVIRRCADGDRSLRDAVEQFVSAAKADAQAGNLETSDLEIFCPQIIEIQAIQSNDSLLRKFAHIDGQWLLPFPREEAPEKRPQKTISAAQKLRETAKRAGIPAPRPYLAVVDFDGDEMGKWLSGTHGCFPTVKDTLHRRVVEMIGSQYSNLDNALKQRRFLNPSFHASLSAAAAAFARFSAPMTVEGEDFPGHLVYAGGDDALFVAPVPEALELAWRLRLRFSGWPEEFQIRILEGGGFKVIESEVRTRVNERWSRPSSWVAAALGVNGLAQPVSRPFQADRLGLAFGTRATASAGICVFHYRWPLGSALREARGALEEAKRRGRNAVGLTVQRRSGSISRAVLPFFVEDEAAREFPTVALMQLISLFRKSERVVSVRLATAFREELAALHIEPRAGRLGPASQESQLWDLGEAIAKRVVRRRDVGGSKEEQDTAERLVLELGRGVRARAQADAAAALFQWSEALSIAAFLARTGDEG
ncbi:MAG: hypothetical protein KatS3mg077_0569 [Candidatus Binatia bacterium]|nr:MAG: hypothetical protein KatS3mg077_0569 [Candidatus Binatia bacterium]